MPDVRLRLKPGGMDTTLHEAALGLEASPLVRNCQTEEGVWKVDHRQRTFTLKDSGFSSGLSQGLGFYGDKDREKILAVNNVLASTIDPAHALGSKGDADLWDADDAQGDCVFEAGDYFFWQHGAHEFMAGGASGYVFYFDLERTADDGFEPCRPLYRDYFLDTAGELNVSIPPYTDYKYLVEGTDSITSVRGSVNIETDGGFFWSRQGFTNGDTNETFEVTYGSAQNFGRIDYLYFEGKNLDNDWFRKADGRVYFEDEEYHFRLYDGSAWHEARLIPIIILADPNTVAFWIDLTPIARSDRDSITKYSLRIAINIHSDIEIKFSPMRLGGVWQGKKSTDGFINDVQPGSVTGEIEYAYAFFDVSLAAFSNAVRLPSVPRSVTLGEKINSASHFMAAELTFTVEPTTDPPYISTDKVVLYRRQTDGDWVEITNSAVHTGLIGGPTRVDNVRDAGTNEPPKIQDRLTQEEVDSLTSVAITFGNETDPTPSGQVKGAVCGASWKGANCIGHEDGFVYMSDATDFRRSLWYGVNVGKLEGDNAEPRTVEVDANKILALVGQDALYAFSKTAGYAFVGDVPNKSDLVRLPTVRGATGTRAACAFLGGALFGSHDGLYYVEIPPRVAGVSQEIKPIEMTAGNRRAWRDLLGDSPETLVVVHHAQHVWCFNGAEYLHLWPSGKWCYGEWADGMQVKAAVAHPYYGVVLQATDGTLRTIGEFPTDGGAETDGSDGEDVLWEYTSAKLYADMALNHLSLRTNEIGTRENEYAESDVEVDVWSHKQQKFHRQNGSPPDVKTIQFRDNTEMMKGVPPACGGRWVQLTLRGNGYDEVYVVELVTTQDSPNTP